MEVDKTIRYFWITKNTPFVDNGKWYLWPSAGWGEARWIPGRSSERSLFLVELCVRVVARYWFLVGWANRLNREEFWMCCFKGQPRDVAIQGRNGFCSTCWKHSSPNGSTKDQTWRADYHGILGDQHPSVVLLTHSQPTQKHWDQINNSFIKSSDIGAKGGNSNAFCLKHLTQRRYSRRSKARTYRLVCGYGFSKFAESLMDNRQKRTQIYFIGFSWTYILFLRTKRSARA